MQAVTTALAATVGTGNIVGVTGAIALGGPGAVFWMEISALLGMATKFSEVTLATKYREKNDKGDWVGGPMYYIRNGLGKKWAWLGGVFAVLGGICAFGIGNTKPYAGKYNVKEVFGELVVPLAKDVAFAKSAEITLAGRVTDYSTSGRVETWKVGGTYQPVDDVRLRFTRSLDIRAPSLQELYTGATQGRASVVDKFKSTSTTFNIQQIGGGNAALEPETAHTTSAGIVYSPSFLPGFTVSADYYDIKIRDVISTISVQQIVDRCFAGNADICNQIRRVNGDIIEIRSTNLNLNQLRSNGWDFEAGYRTSLDTFAADLKGNVGVRVLANYVGEFSTFDGTTKLNVAGALADQQPTWTVQGVYFYETGPFRVTVSNRYVGKGLVSNQFTAPREIDDNTVASRLYTNLNLNYKFDKFGSRSEVYLNVDNVFNIKPPKGFGWNYGLAASPIYDVIGPMFKVGLRVQY